MRKREAAGRGKKAPQSFFQGALVLTAGMAVVKVIGALFKIPLKRVIGEYGMGLFNVAYNFYGPVFSLATAGFPIAIARMVSENRSLGRWKDIKRVRQVSFPAFLLLGLLGMGAMTLFAPLYCEAVSGNRHALAPMLALAPAILFACGASVFRGYYEGLRDMTPTAVSEVVEAGAKLLIGLSAACVLVSWGTKEYAASGTVFSLRPASPQEAMVLTLSFAAAGAVFGVTCGSVFSFLYLWLHHRFRGDGITPEMYQGAPEPAGKRELRGRLLRITLPVALGSLATNLAGLIDATLLQNRIGEAMKTAPERLLSHYEGMIPALYLENPGSIPTFLYGCYTLAMTVYLLVPSVTQAFGVSALPSVTEAWTKGGKERLKSSIETVARLSSLFCFPAGLGLCALAEPVTQVLYGREASSPIISEALFLLGLASLATAMCTPMASMLQAVGRLDLPVKLLAAAMVLKVAVSYWLCGIPELALSGAAVGTLCCYLFLFFSQFWCLRRAAGIEISLFVFGKPLVCSVLCGLSARLAYRLLSGFLYPGVLLPLLGAVACGAVVYLAGLLFLGGIEKSDLFALPKGQKIAKMLEKHEWI